MEGYVNLEFNLYDVKRGDRQEHVREIILLYVKANLH